MKRIETVYHKGKEIIRFDYQGLKEDQEVIAFVDEVAEYLTELNRPTLQLTNVTGVFFTPAVMKHLSAAGKQTEHLIIRDAIIGVVGVKKILLQVYNSIMGGKAKAFDTEEDAMEWLIS